MEGAQQIFSIKQENPRVRRKNRGTFCPVATNERPWQEASTIDSAGRRIFTSEGTQSIDDRPVPITERPEPVSYRIGWSRFLMKGVKKWKPGSEKTNPSILL
jgi:hypothetical protein